LLGPALPRTNRSTGSHTHPSKAGEAAPGAVLAPPQCRKRLLGHAPQATVRQEWKASKAVLLGPPAPVAATAKAGLEGAPPYLPRTIHLPHTRLLTCTHCTAQGEFPSVSCTAAPPR